MLQPELRKLAQKLLLQVCCRTAYGIAEEISGVINFISSKDRESIILQLRSLPAEHTVLAACSALQLLGLSSTLR